MSWTDYDLILADVEGRNPVTGRQPAMKRNSVAAASMRRLYAKRRAAGLNAHGQPLKQPNKINHRYL